MIKKAIKLMLVLVMILGVVFTISNFFPKTADATMLEELLHYYEIPGGYTYYCTPGGQGCYTIEAPVE